MDKNRIKHIEDQANNILGRWTAGIAGAQIGKFAKYCLELIKEIRRLKKEVELYAKERLLYP